MLIALIIRKIYMSKNVKMIKIDPYKYPILASKPLEQWHKEMWEYLAKYPYKNKEDFARETFTEDECDLLYLSWYCFACLFAGRGILTTKNSSCDYCPLCSYGQSGLNCLHGLFDKWFDAKKAGHYEQVTKTATQIANLQWRVK